MSIKKGDGVLRAVIITDDSPAVMTFIHRILDGADIKNGSLEIFSEQSDSANVILAHAHTIKCALLIHSCEIDTQNQGINIISGDKDLDSATAKLIQIMRPALCVRESAGQFHSKITHELLNRKIPCLGFVLPPLDPHNEKGLEHAITSVRYFLHEAGLIDAPYVRKMVAVFKRKEVHAPCEGIFHPQLLLFEKVEPGDIVGEIESGKESTPLLSPGKGKVIELRTHQKIKMGDLVFSLGEEIGFYEF